MRPITAVCLVATVLSGLAMAEPYSDPARGFSLILPEGWSDPAGGATTKSPDGTVLCTLSSRPNKATEGQTQDQVNAALAGEYTDTLWQAQFFGSGQEGQIEASGVTRYDGLDAPWAKGTFYFKDAPKARFDVIVFQAPGQIVSATCTGAEADYLKHQNEAVAVLQSLRPLS